MRGKRHSMERVHFGFLAFAVLFVVAFATGQHFASLVIVFTFAAVFAAAYYVYAETPGRRDESERIVQALREQWRRRWEERPPIVQDADYYLRRATGSHIYYLVAPLALVLIAFLIWLLSAMRV